MAPIYTCHATRIRIQVYAHSIPRPQVLIEAFLQEDTMTEAWHHVEDAMASIDQGGSRSRCPWHEGAVSLVAIALGAVLVARGFALMKPSFAARSRASVELTGGD